jgi:hypothetical protein
MSVTAPAANDAGGGDGVRAGAKSLPSSGSAGRIWLDFNPDRERRSLIKSSILSNGSMQFISLNGQAGPL